MTVRRNGPTRIGIGSLLLLVPIGACSDASRPPVPRRSSTEILDELDRTRREREGRTEAEIMAELQDGRHDGDGQETVDWFVVPPDNNAAARARSVEAAESARRARVAAALQAERAAALQADSGSGRDGSVAAHALPWYEGGALHAANGRQWLAAPARNRLATAADFVAGFWRRDGYSERHVGQMVLDGSLRAAAEIQVDCITRMLNERADRQSTIAIIAAACYVTD